MSCDVLLFLASRRDFLWLAWWVWSYAQWSTSMALLLPTILMLQVRGFPEWVWSYALWSTSMALLPFRILMLQVRGFLLDSPLTLWTMLVGAGDK